ncbi:MAG: hypothetical protein GXP45_04435 [bacterium]|nr:hypothetical protein [bacterium]
MSKYFHQFKHWFFKQYHKLQKLPKRIKWSLAIFLIIFGALNIVNPFINGIFLIILGLSLLSETLYEKFYHKLHKHLTPHKKDQ